MEFHDKLEIEISFNRIVTLLNCGIFHPQNAGNPLLQSAFIEVLICLRDLMYKTKSYAKRIDFTDDVTIEGEVKDVTSLIEYVRNALCHIHSGKHFVEPRNIMASYNVVFGKGAGGALFKMGDFEQSNPYADDICLFIGRQRILLKRHIMRALEESRSLLAPLLKR